MAKDNKIIFWVIGAILIMIIMSNSNIFKKEEELSLKVHYYKEGVEVSPRNKLFDIFSIITPPGGSYDQISFDIVATNTGNVPISSLQIVDASPQVFFDSLPQTTSSLALGESKVLWSSDLMDTSQFEIMVQPVNFWVKVKGEDSTGQLIEYRETSVSLTIELEGEFLVVDSAITLGGNQEYDGITVTPSGIIYVDPSIRWLNLTAIQYITIDGTINGLGRGYAGGGGGSCKGNAQNGYSGSGSNPGVGGDSEKSTYSIYGGGGGGAGMSGSSSSFDLEIGSGGGGGGCSSNSVYKYAYGGAGGTGGAGIQLNANSIMISGTINSNGGSGGAGICDNAPIVAAGSGGGGAAGTVLLNARNVTITGTISAETGGAGGCCTYGSYTSCGYGSCNGPGRIKIFYTDNLNTASGTFNYGSGSYYTQQI